METKDRTQASYNLVDINEQTRIAFEKCKETKEQKIERLKKEIEIDKKLIDKNKFSKRIVETLKGNIRLKEGAIKELENDGRNSKN